MNKIIKIGVDSMALILPKKDAEHFGFRPGDNLIVEISKNEIKAKRL